MASMTTGPMAAIPPVFLDPPVHTILQVKGALQMGMMLVSQDGSG